MPCPRSGAIIKGRRLNDGENRCDEVRDAMSTIRSHDQWQVVNETSIDGENRCDEVQDAMSTIRSHTQGQVFNGTLKNGKNKCDEVREVNVQSEAIP